MFWNVVLYVIMVNINGLVWISANGRIAECSIDGKPIRIIGTSQDITDRKIIEEELKEKCKQLELQKVEADKANQAKSQFLANMSHEIRNPLNGILGVLQLLQTTSMNKDQEKYFRIMKDSVDTLMTLVNDVLDLSKIESGMLKNQNEPFHLKDTITAIYNHLLFMGNLKGLEISFYFDPKINCNVIGDELKLKQILTNLISNAIKYTEHGYISFRIRLLAANNEFQKIEFRVKDSGIGIKEEIKGKIFEIYMQGDFSNKKKYAGTGLGLAISRQLVELMNGELWFESIEGKGSSFYFVCNFEKLNENSNTVSEDSNKLTTGNANISKTVLSVEDNLINQDVLENIIKKMGYHFIAAYNGKEALTILKNTKVDLILMDIQMPEMNGFKTTEIIRRDYRNLDKVPIIAMTAYAMQEDKNKCIDAGMDNYISKPFQMENLTKLINQYLKN